MEYSAGFFTAMSLIAMGLQAFWSLFTAFVNCYADLVNSWVQGYYGAVFVYNIGNWVTSTLTFVAAYASAVTFTSCVDDDDDNWFFCFLLIGMAAVSELVCRSL
ncbi:hypothetical protein LguiB_013224 [Lonicera macranthoides]